MDTYTPVMLPSALAEQVSAADLAGLVRQHLTKKAEYAYRGIDYDGLTSLMAPPVVEPARVRFKDVQTGQWMAGVSQPLINPNHLRIALDIKAYAPCRYRAHHRPEGCRCKKRLTGIRTGPANLSTVAFANFIRAGIFGTTTSITDTTSNSRSVTKAIDGGTNQLTGCAGTGATAASINDTNMQTQTEQTNTVTVNALSGSAYTVTFTVTATALRSYQEVGIKITTTSTAWVFLITHDSFSTLSVSNGGTLATTYTVTFT